MRYALVLALFVPAVAFGDDYTPAPAASVPGYSATVLPCKITHDEDRGLMHVECSDHSLDGKSLRELAILRNTIYARWGWDGYRKPWLRDYFHAQPWFHANAKFGYHLVSDADKKNAHLIAQKEQSFTDVELWRMMDDVYARHGKVFGDMPEVEVRGKKRKTCELPKDADDGVYEEIWSSKDCRYKKVAWYKPDPSYTDAKLTSDDKIELGLLSRALGHFALDGNIDYDDKGKGDSLDKLLDVAQLRQLSMRDLRLLRNTIYARRGRAFKSQILKDHFAGMSWYKVDATYSDARLSKTDSRNIALIKSVENEFGGPLSDEDYLAEPSTDGA